MGYFYGGGFMRYFVICYNYGFINPRIYDCYTRKEALKMAWYCLDCGYDIIEIEDKEELEDV